MQTTKEHDERIANMTFSSVYPHYVVKVEKKGRTTEELHQVIAWLTGFDAKDLQRLLDNQATFTQFFAEARLNPNAQLITGTICGYNESQQRHYFQKQIVDTANHFNYFANFDKHRSWVRMTLTTEQEFDYVVTFHGYGHGDSGILAASAFTYLKVPREDGATEMVNLHPAATDLFQFNYAEPFESTQKRFAEWLDSSLAIAMAEWKRSIQA